MTNRPKRVDFAGTMDAVLTDVAMTYPQDHAWLRRDSKRIRQALLDRGLKFLTLDLPALGDYLLASLDSERLIDPNGIPFSRSRWNDSRIPKLFSSIWLRIFQRDGLLRDDADPTAIFFLLTLTSMWKKLELECSSFRLKEAYDEYYDIEEDLPPASEIWSDVDRLSRASCGSLVDYDSNPESGPYQPDFFGEGGRSSLLGDCQRAADILAAELGYIDPESIVGRHGPGAVSDLPGSSSKYEFPSWSERLDDVLPFDLHGALNASCVPWDGQYTHGLRDFYSEACSVLVDVPKTAKAPRLIAKEPTANQWCQQGVQDVIRDRVSASHLGLAIDFSSQEPSQDDCRSSSLTSDRATIDLSSASDRLSCSLVQRVFRANLSVLRLLSVTRTRFLMQNSFRHLPKVIRLRKFASMGSALTFPVQSIVFASLAVGCGLHLNPKASVAALIREVRVFGDDIIIPKEWVPTLLELFKIVGLKVNVTKSFWNGKFRESCGMYAWSGYEVTPFRIRLPSLGTDASSTSAAISYVNNAFIKGLWHTSRYIERIIGRKFPTVDRRVGTFVPVTNSKGLNPEIKTSWNKNLQCSVIRWRSPIDRFSERRVLEGPNASAYLIGKSYDDITDWKALLRPKTGDFESLVRVPEKYRRRVSTVYRTLEIPAELFSQDPVA